jgi:hypothetical protein
MTAGTLASPVGAFVAQVGGTFLGSQGSAGQRLGDPFFQALTHWISGPPDSIPTSTLNDSFERVLAGQLLPLPRTGDRLDNLNWDEVSMDLEWQGAGDPLTWRGRDELAVHKTLLPTAAPPAAAQATLDQYFAQVAAATDQIVDDD